MGAEVVAKAIQVSVTYATGARARMALAPTDLQIQRGDRIALIGPSGSGKSTLLHCLSGLISPSSGVVTWPTLGRPIKHPGAIATVFQAPSLISALTVVENVELPLLIQGLKPAEARVRAHQALRELNLEFLTARLPEELSGGQSQRVAVARVIVGSPQLILADEPTGQLDAAAGTLVVEALLHCAEVHHAALIVATHDQHVADHFPIHLLVDDGHVAMGINEEGRQS